METQTIERQRGNRTADPPVSWYTPEPPPSSSQQPGWAVTACPPIGSSLVGAGAFRWIAGDPSPHAP